jgi:hypothetical protein
MVSRTLKQLAKNKNYGICDLKLEIKIKLNMATLEFITHESKMIHGTT